MSKISEAHQLRIKSFFKAEGNSKWNAKNGVTVLERPLTPAELAVWNGLRDNAEEVALEGRVGEFPGGSYQTFTMKDGTKGKVAVKDPSGQHAAYAKVFRIPATLVFPVVDRSGAAMPDLVYQQEEDAFEVVTTGTVQPTRLMQAAANVNRKRLANVEELAAAMERQADLAIEMEKKALAMSDDAGARALLLSWGHSAELVASLTI